MKPDLTPSGRESFITRTVVASLGSLLKSSKVPNDIGPALVPDSVRCEVHRTWNRPDAAQLAEIYMMVSPNYRAVMESYRKAQEVVSAKQTGIDPTTLRSTTPKKATAARR